MTWTFHEHERFPGYGWIEPIMHPKWHLLDMKVGKHIVDEHKREMDRMISIDGIRPLVEDLRSYLELKHGEASDIVDHKLAVNRLRELVREGE